MQSDLETDLRAWRRAKGLKQEQVAELLGVSKNRVSNLERGGSCSLALAARIEAITEGMVTAAAIHETHVRLQGKAAA